MTSRQETPIHSTGAHRRHRAQAGRSRADREPERGARGQSGRRDGHPPRPRGTLPMQPPAHYEPYLDGLFTYCLSILCEHDAAAAALGEVLALAERQRVRLRDPALRRPWLYALARWVCLRRLAAGRRAVPPASEAVAAQRRAQLAALAWPEAAGTTPEQREALELAVRHQMAPREVAHVLGVDAEVCRNRLARAACEVERTRTALAVVDSGRCPDVSQLAGEPRVLLGPALRDELVRHVDECAVCRRAAERVVAEGPWPGAPDAAAMLALVEAPRSAAYAALLHAMDTGFGRARESTPRFDRRGFPVDLVDVAARRAQLRHRAMTGTMVAAVVAAPVLAVWAAYRATPLGEGGHGARSAASPDGIDGVPYEKAGSAGPTTRGTATVAPGSPSAATAASVAVAVSGGTAPPSATAAGAGWLQVSARLGHGRTFVTLTAGGGAPVRWKASTTAYWLEFPARSGTLKPGETVTLVIRVDRAMEPRGVWTARIAFDPGDAVVTLRGSAARSAPPSRTGGTPTPSVSAPAATPTDPGTQPPTSAPPTDSPSPTPTAASTPPDSAPPASASPTPTDTATADPSGQG